MTINYTTWQTMKSNFVQQQKVIKYNNNYYKVDSIGDRELYTCTTT